ncbi:MAG: bifunctional demethylmenaquinone methyltransferase/2-methoxy-6-polyprenyl-1,4-benzoquinol methylase UbiE [Sphingobacteriales bacterium]|jgi:demethylmenaquinone methyltransferase/2-methoxy-6-polyprenyl-1,4-benzoquinol methylase|nr:bifunctional demethylmenaquinone methyltransferase/2-methoxy-6-polyprenyl-1,4-benzoquinol methylase UbiE [Sphingobacteriales bacterium]
MSVVPKAYSGSTKRERVEGMFDSIARRYDLMNRLLSGGIDRSWRRKAIDTLIPYKPERILDIATGTADVAIECMRLKPQEIVGIDISNRMLDIGRHKVMEKGFQGLIRLEQCASEAIHYPETHFDAVTVAFGVRNFESLDGGLREIHRVLRPGGRLVVLEFSMPQRFPIKQLYSFYSFRVMPWIGQWITRERSAYEYLPESVAAFPYGEAFLDRLRNAGFKDTKCIPLTFGIVSLYLAEK